MLQNQVSGRDFYFFNTKLGIRKIFYGIGYHAYLEYPVVFNNLKIEKNSKTLDIGTGQHSIFPLFLSYHNNCTVYCIDIGNYVLKQLNFAKKLKIPKDRFIVEIQDARCLKYEDNFFDNITAISSLEHIPDDGDIEAVKEIKRVLKVGGRFIVSVPYQFENYKEQDVCRDVYERKCVKKPVFFSRYYDDENLKKRLIEPSGLKLIKTEYLGEKNFKFYYDFWCKFIPLRNTLKHLIGFSFPVFSKMFLSSLDEKGKRNASVCVFVFEK